jgi:hypothetical protein
MAKNYFFIDESGDAAFYAKRKKLIVGQEGFQPMLNIGMVTMTDKSLVRKSIVDFRQRLLDDPLYNTLPCLRDPQGYLHARSDQIDVRAKFVEFLRQLDGYRVYIVLGRKRLRTFENKHNNNEKEFYFDLVYHLLKDRMDSPEDQYQIFLSAREKSTQKYLGDAISKAVERDNTKRPVPIDIHYQYDIVRSQDTPELSIIDYFLWALQRYILVGEDRYYKALQHKFNLIIDLYDTAHDGSNYYHPSYPFTITMASPFQSDGYL